MGLPVSPGPFSDDAGQFHFGKLFGHGFSLHFVKVTGEFLGPEDSVSTFKAPIRQSRIKINTVHFGENLEGRIAFVLGNPKLNAIAVKMGAPPGGGGIFPGEGEFFTIFFRNFAGK